MPNSILSGQLDMLKCFPPIAAGTGLPMPRVLVLGSMPSAKSLEDDFYYAHPQNRFWPMMASIFGAPLPQGKHVLLSRDEKIRMLVEHGIALWDVIGKCRREGSLDSSIKDFEVNDFAAFLEAHPTIELVLLNGGKAADVWARHVAPTLKRPIAARAMPSTSPANAKLRLDDLIPIWREALAAMPASGFSAEQGAAASSEF